MSKNFDLSQIFEKKFWFWSKVSKKLDFSENLNNINLVKFSENFDFGKIFEKISISPKISKYYDFSQIFEQFRF